MSRSGSFEVARAISFLQQVDNPWESSIESALKWRLLIPSIAHFSGIRGWAALSISWLGVVVLLAQTTWTILSSTRDRWLAFTGCVLVASSSAVVVSTGWLGINDAWYLSGLLTVAFAKNPLWLLGACLISPWFDEKFLIALPIAILTRWHQDIQSNTKDAIFKLISLITFGIIPYVATRLYVTFFYSDPSSASFFKSVLTGFTTWLPWAHLGWWMAFRLGWIFIGVSFWLILRVGGLRYLFITLFLFLSSFLAITILAADMSRSAAMVLPLLVWGWSNAPSNTVFGNPNMRNIIVLSNLLIPSMHVTYTKASLISPLPLEIFRVLKCVGSACFL
ncbi:hypothetical protein H6F42_15035 [Pseudanabaena sp. FACHB-1998]|uniref:hypothetical protein n=1 Tax=Pseudanabaena sp. FACHB-1998 TaxID=2692858 RepID=UPI0016800FD0|nr:hypothetical protein [Pseudanabaena sp. FACHB-1998]MBD2178231.1 hypothetical protein [Pseudanabaena sp. FACHB-1998]